MSYLRTSDVLSALAAHGDETVTVRYIVAALRDRAFALLVVLLGLPNCLPMPPPIPLICGLLLGLVAVQIAGGRASPWLPERLLNRSIPRKDLASAVKRAMGPLRQLERFSRPRVGWFHTQLSLRLIGLALVTMAMGLLVAAPIVGQIPLGIAVCLIGLGLVERDGVIVILGLVAGTLGVTLSFSFVYAVVAGLELLF